MSRQDKILIVDDDSDFVEATKSLLKSRSYEVVTAGNAKMGLEQVKDEDPDLIILDVMMKGLSDGFNLCWELKHHPQYKGIPILMLTSVNEKSGFRFSPKTDGEYLEADEYREKPIPAEELFALVETLLKKAGDKP